MPSAPASISRRTSSRISASCAGVGGLSSKPMTCSRIVGAARRPAAAVVDGAASNDDIKSRRAARLRQRQRRQQDDKREGEEFSQASRHVVHRVVSMWRKAVSLHIGSRKLTALRHIYST